LQILRRGWSTRNGIWLMSFLRRRRLSEMYSDDRLAKRVILMTPFITPSYISVIQINQITSLTKQIHLSSTQIVHFGCTLLMYSHREVDMYFKWNDFQLYCLTLSSFLCESWFNLMISSKIIPYYCFRGCQWRERPIYSSINFWV
jgi:hypothetical protein